MLSSPLKLCVLRNEPIKGRTRDGLPLSTESNFTLLNSMRPFNECWLQPLAIPYFLFVYYVCLSFPALHTISPYHFHYLSLSVAHFIALFFCQSDCQFFCSLPFFFCLALALCLPLLHPPFTPQALACVSPQQSPWYLVLFTVELPDY